MSRLRLLSTLALASTIDALRPAFEMEHGVAIEATLMPTAVLMPRIRAGERADAAVLTDAGIAALIAEGVLAAPSRLGLAWSSVGIAVRAGAPRPAIGTEAELVAALLDARSVGLSRAGASGLYFERLLQRLGIAEVVNAKAVVIESGYTGTLAAEGRVDIAVQQVSELLMVPGVDVVGPLPPGLGAESLFTGAAFVGAAEPGLASALLATIAAAHGILREHGLAPA